MNVPPGAPPPAAQTNSGARDLIGFVVHPPSAEGRTRVTLDVGPQHLNYHGIAHGGIVAVLLDTASGQAASTHFMTGAERPAVLTITLTVNFLRPCLPGPVQAIARATGGGRKTVTCEAELLDASGEVLAKSMGVFKLVGR
ncbi:MAG: PaaI family thioesterase [Paracoccus denitrificans]|nr:MAG: PaaI family thioesterase [Paracoccus denitrificans]PZO84276.1 MAG: PaaI family thioesterase [Paracoccus denitrificans]